MRTKSAVAFTLAYASLCAALPSAAEDYPARLRECRRIADKLERLACFDAVPSILVYPGPDASSPDSKWEFRANTAGAPGQAKFATWVDNATETASLAFKCDHIGKRSLYVQMRAPSSIGPTSSGERMIRYRSGSGPTLTASAIPDDRLALVLKRPDVKRLVATASKEERITLLIKAADGRGLEMEFDMADAKAAIGRVASACED